MARLVEESDDELPEIATLFTRPQKLQCMKISTAPSGTIGRQEATRATSPNSKPERKGDLTNDIGGEGSKLEKKKLGASAGRSHSKKRVLKQTSENPLLRPLPRTNISTATSVLLRVPERSKPENLAKKGGKAEVRRNLSNPLPVEPKSTKEDSCEVRATKRVNRRNAAGKNRLKTDRRYHTSEDDFEDESDGLSDFIVDDSALLEEEQLMVEKPAPRPARRLVKGRRPVEDHLDKDQLDSRMRQLTVEDGLSRDLRDESGLNEDDALFRRSQASKPVGETRSKMSRPEKDKENASKKPSESNSDSEDPFTLRL